MSDALTWIGPTRSTYATSDLLAVSAASFSALYRPVTITQRNKAKLVLLSVEDYRRLPGRHGDVR